jgi:hypothetical protein
LPEELSERMMFLSMDDVEEHLLTGELGDRWPELMDFLRNELQDSGVSVRRRESLQKACFSNLNLTVIKMTRQRPWEAKLVMCTQGRPDTWRTTFRGHQQNQRVTQVYFRAR